MFILLYCCKWIKLKVYAIFMRLSSPGMKAVLQPCFFFYIKIYTRINCLLSIWSFCEILEVLTQESVSQRSVSNVGTKPVDGLQMIWCSVWIQSILISKYSVTKILIIFQVHHIHNKIKLMCTDSTVMNICTWSFTNIHDLWQYNTALTVYLFGTLLYCRNQCCDLAVIIRGVSVTCY